MRTRALLHHQILSEPKAQREPRLFGTDKVFLWHSHIKCVASPGTKADLTTQTMPHSTRGWFSWQQGEVIHWWGPSPSLWKSQPSERYVLKTLIIRDTNGHSYGNIYCIIIHNSQTRQAIPGPGWTGKRNKWSSYNGRLFSRKKEGHSDTRVNLENVVGEISQTPSPAKKEKYCVLPNYMGYLD